MSPPIPVLLVAHQMPPLGGPGTRRPASFVREWPSHGIDPVVLCAPCEDGARFHGYPIVAGSDAVLAGRTIERLATPEPSGFAGLLARTGLPHRVAWTLAYGRVREPETPWGHPAIEAGIALGRRQKVRAVVSTSQPFETHVVGRAVAGALEIPWIADFRDPMTEAEGRSWPTRLHWWLERREERAWFRAAALVWATCESAALRWRARFPDVASKIRVRRNGIGPVDLGGLPSAPVAPPFRIGHIGRFTDSPRRSRLRRLDSRPGGRGGDGSTPRPLFTALERFLKRRPDAAGQVVWMTVGSASIDTPPAGVAAELHAPVSNEQALYLAASCHALYLPLTRPNRFGSQFVQQKVYEYAALGRPVLATGAPGEAVRLLGSLARLAADGDVETLSRHVEAQFDARGHREPADVPVAPLQSDVAALCARDLVECVNDASRGDRPR